MRVYLNLGTFAEIDAWRVANAQYRCRAHPDVVSTEPDRCHCGEKLSPVVPIGLMFIDEDEWLRMLEAHAARVHGA